MNNTLLICMCETRTKWKHNGYMTLQSTTFSIWVKDDPVKYTAAESWRFPAGVLPISGWLLHFLLNWQWGHSWLTAKKVPRVVFWTSHAALHTGQIWNSWRRQSSYTMYLGTSYMGGEACLLKEYEHKKKKKGKEKHNAVNKWRHLHQNWHICSALPFTALEIFQELTIESWTRSSLIQGCTWSHEAPGPQRSWRRLHHLHHPPAVVFYKVERPSGVLKWRVKVHWTSSLGFQLQQPQTPLLPEQLIRKHSLVKEGRL